MTPPYLRRSAIQSGCRTVPLGCVAATPRVPRGSSEGARRGDAAGTTRIVRGGASRRRRGCRADRPRRHVAATPTSELGAATPVLDDFSSVGPLAPSSRRRAPARPPRVPASKNHGVFCSSSPSAARSASDGRGAARAAARACAGAAAAIGRGAGAAAAMGRSVAVESCLAGLGLWNALAPATKSSTAAAAVRAMALLTRRRDRDLLAPAASTVRGSREALVRP